LSWNNSRGARNCDLGYSRFLPLVECEERTLLLPN